ncbi:hypothetical protein SDC9_212807 [bioreactor metagenome]|uniref:Uncharacterized protein n=1 Tax=bioreactor metagenome TaxID=1076179 RepID=A0A645JMZ2_9ZZZZ
MFGQIHVDDHLAHVGNGDDDLFAAAVHADFDLGIAPEAVRVAVGHDSADGCDQLHHGNPGGMAFQLAFVVADG